MKAQAQVVDFKEYRDRKAGGRPCGGTLYNLFHPNSSTSAKNTLSSPPGIAPPGHYWKCCSKRGWILKKRKQVELKKENPVENIDHIISKKEQKKQERNEQDSEIKKEDELSRMVKADYMRMQREITEQINNYRKVQNYEELEKNNKRKASINNTSGLCPLCGSKINNEGHEEKTYSKAA